jgi:methylmalonyl-CoA mutase N-terminal domain/subunit
VVIPKDDDTIRERIEAWRQRADAAPKRKGAYKTLSQLPVEPMYGPSDLADAEYLADIGLPGEYPYLRGVHPSGYRSRLWTMRMFAGFGQPAETNERFRFLLDQGETGLSVAFDMPTLYGYDHDDERARGEFGKCGVAVSCLEDMQTVFDGIPLDQVTTSMTINSPAAIIWAMYIAAAERQGAKIDSLGGTIQNDILKEYIAQNEYIFPPQPSMRLVTDTVEFAARRVPRWNPISISGYHIREAGATAVQELAFTLYAGLTYVEEVVEAGLSIDAFAPRLSFFFDIHSDFFEEIAKLRAARRIWAREIERRYRPQNPRSMLLRTHAQTAGVSLSAQQPYNNVVRVALQALAAVLGGTQSLHTNALDEALALPTEETARIALRTQQIIAHESGAGQSIDPLGGSYYLETLTDNLEQAAYAYFRELDDLQGMVRAVELGYPQREISRAAYQYQQKVENREELLVGINTHVDTDEAPPEILQISAQSEKAQIEQLRQFRQRRSQGLVDEKLQALRTVACTNQNIFSEILEAVKAYGTVGEISDVLRDAWGVYEEPKAHF